MDNIFGDIENEKPEKKKALFKVGPFSSRNFLDPLEVVNTEGEKPVATIGGVTVLPHIGSLYDIPESFSANSDVQQKVHNPWGRSKAFSSRLEERKKIIEENNLDIDADVSVLTRSASYSDQLMSTPKNMIDPRLRKAMNAQPSLDPVGALVDYFAGKGNQPEIDSAQSLNDPALKQKYIDNYRKIEQLKKERPELGLKSDFDIMTEVKREALAARERAEKVPDNFLSNIAWFAGGMYGAVQDPATAASVVLSGGGFGLAKTAIASTRLSQITQAAVKAGATDGAIEATLGLSQAYGEAEFRKFLGEDTTTTQVMKERLVEAGLTAGLSATIAAGTRFITTRNGAKLESETGQGFSDGHVKMLSRMEEIGDTGGAGRGGPDRSGPQPSKDAEFRDATQDLSDGVDFMRDAPDGVKTQEEHISNYKGAVQSVVNDSYTSPDKGVDSEFTLTDEELSASEAYQNVDETNLEDFEKYQDKRHRHGYKALRTRIFKPKKALEQRFNTAGDRLTNDLDLLDSELSAVDTYVGHKIGMILSRNLKLKRFFGFGSWKVDEMRDIFENMFNGSYKTKDPELQGYQDAFREMFDEGRQRMVAAGFNVKEVDGYFGVQVFRQDKVRKAQMSQFVADFSQAIEDGRIMLNDLEGRLDNIEARTQFLENFYDDVRTFGQAKLLREDLSKPPSFKGAQSMTTKAQAPRFIRFKDFDTYIEFMEKYGNEDLMENAINSVISQHKTAAIGRRYGPKPRRVIEALEQEVNARGVKENPNYNRKDFVSLFDLAVGNIPIHRTLASQVSNVVKSFNTARLLGKAAISQLSDLSRLTKVSQPFDQSYMKAVGNSVRQMAGTKTAKQDAFDMLLPLEALSMNSSAIKRYGDLDAVGKVEKVAKGFADGVITYTGMARGTQAVRQAAGIMINRGLADHAGTMYSKLPKNLKVIFELYDIGPKDWGAIRKSVEKNRVKVGGDTVRADFIDVNKLLKEDIDAGAKYMAMVDYETGIMINNPKLSFRAKIRGTAPRGSLIDILRSHLTHIKTFMITTLFGETTEIFKSPKYAGLPNRLKAVLGLTVSGVLYGTLAFELKSILSGYYNENMEASERLANGFFEAGFLSLTAAKPIAGKAREGKLNQYTAKIELLNLIGGPAVGLLTEMVGNVNKAVKKKSLLPAVDQARSLSPKPWYLQKFLDDLFWDRLREKADYLEYRKTERRREKYRRKSGVKKFQLDELFK